MYSKNFLQASGNFLRSQLLYAFFIPERKTSLLASYNSAYWRKGLKSNKGCISCAFQPPGGNFTNILLAAFAPKSFCRKITNPSCKHLKSFRRSFSNPNCQHIKGTQKTFVRKIWSYNIGEIDTRWPHGFKICLTTSPI